jgi:hypothetical protein
MGIIEEIADIVPKVQKRIAEDGTDLKEAIFIELKKLGYIPEKEGECKFEAASRSKNESCSSNG